MRDCLAPNCSSFGRVKVEDSERMWDFVKPWEVVQPDVARGWRGGCVRDWFAPNISSFGRVKVEDSERMWDVVKALGGRSA